MNTTPVPTEMVQPQPATRHIVCVGLPLTDDVCAAFICTALEGGIGYWCAASEIVQRPAANPSFEGDFDYVSFVANDTENTDDEDDAAFKPQKVDYDTIRVGIERFLANESIHWDHKRKLLLDLLGEDELFVRTDADTADTVVQLGLFNEIVFG